MANASFKPDGAARALPAAQPGGADASSLRLKPAALRSYTGSRRIAGTDPSALPAARLQG